MSRRSSGRPCRDSTAAFGFIRGVTVRWVFRLVALSSLAAAMSLAAVPRHAAAASEVDLRFEVTVEGQPPTEKELQLFASPSPLNPNQPSPQTLFVFCGFQGSCQDGRTYHWDFPHVALGTVLTYRFQVVTYPGYSSVAFASGKFTATRTRRSRPHSPTTPEQCRIRPWGRPLL